jgi:mono/diheme cytochrome c family protein
VKALPGKGAGRYTARVILPEPGQWTLTINTSFGRITSTLLPIRVIGPNDARPAATPAIDRGAQLFVAKGCIGCHVNGNVDRRTVNKIGPELTERRYPPAYLTKLLADPASVQGVRQGPRMPNLGLREPEIRALVAFINAEPPPAQR